MIKQSSELSRIIADIMPPFLVGLLAKISSDVIGGTKRNFINWIAISCLCLCATFISNWLCEINNISHQTTVVINTFCTLLSEKLFKIVLSNSIPFIRGLVKDNLNFTLTAIDKGGDEAETNMGKTAKD